MLLVTGTPGIGKTTLIRKIIERLRPMRMSGFYTGEIREGASRTGFEVTTLDGKSGRLASVGTGEGPHVGHYRVDLASFEETALPSLELRPEISLYVVDEIGKMECLSKPFVEAMQKLAESDVPLLATVALHGSGFIEDIKSHPRTTILHVTRENRDEMPKTIASRLFNPTR
jgi:nucleoside-triphosphatase